MSDQPNDPKQPNRIIFDLGGKIRVSPPLYFGNKIEDSPGDLLKFAPTGTSIYGYQKKSTGKIFTQAPPHESCGGVIYFDNNISKEDFGALMRILEVQPSYVSNPEKDFAVFTAESSQPGKDGYLTQMRTVSKFGLRYGFRCLSESGYDDFLDQGVSIVEALWAFIEHECEVWGNSFTQDGEKGLRGLFGGDGNFAREQLCFGFTVENSYYHVYRIWSRACLVTK